MMLFLLKRISFLIFCLFPNVLFAQTGVHFSEPSGVKDGAFILTLSTDDPNRTIYYTIDGSEPTAASNLYDEPITIYQPTMVYARSFQNGVSDEFISKAGYTYLSEEVKSFHSNLPVLVVDDLGQGALPNPPPDAFMSGGGELLEKHFSIFSLYEPIGGRTVLTSDPTMESNSGIKVRGSSSSSFPKKSYGLDSWDYQCQETKIEPLGLAESEDWVLFGSRMYDPTYIRSVVPYHLSNQIGQWAPRSVAVEMFLNLDGGEVTMDTYQGIYYFMEKIGRGRDKLDIEKLDYETQPTDPDISGGYIIKVDRLDAEAEGFTTLHSPDQYSYNTTNYYYPKERNMPDYQKPWIRNYISEFETALQQIPNNRDYTNYFDVDACVDHWLLKAMPMEFDAFILSEFMHKSRDGKIKMGPIWDLDRSAGSLDTRQSEPTGSWEGGGPIQYMEYGWYGYLFNDPEFYQRVKDRWFMHREDVFSIENIHSVIDSFADVMNEAMTRDIELWTIDSKYGGTFQGAITFYKDWLAQRVVWIDEQFGYTPEYYNRGTKVKGNTLLINEGYELTMQSPNSQGTIYYTTDGSDPRLEAGVINSNSQQYSSPVVITNSVVIKARVYNNGSWSSFREVAFYVDQDLSKLKITEINYHADDYNGVDGSELEFIELKNTGNETLYLSGVHFADGIAFEFPVDATIEPGEFIVIAANVAVFESTMGENADYQYEMSLSNSGEHIALADAFGNIITEVDYEDDSPWAEIADGTGYTLVPTSINPIGNQDEASLWRASSVLHGSPGADDMLIDIAPIYITELLANSENPPLDAIELFNPNSTSVNISGWLLNDDLSAENAWTIPAGTIIQAGEYLVFYQGHLNGDLIEYNSDEFGSAFSIGSNGDEVYLLSASSTVLTGYAYGYELEASLEDISYGQYTNSVGEVHVVGYESQSFGSENTDLKVGPIVITQIMYNPQGIDGIPLGSKFIQIKNISDETIQLFDADNPENTWRVNGLNFYFNQGTELAPGEIAYIKNSNLSDYAFRRRYELDDTVQLFTFPGNLDVNGEQLSVQMPLEPTNDNGMIEIPYATVDRVRYRSIAPWSAAGGNGMMLQRIQDGIYGNDPAAWQAVDGNGVLPSSYTLTVDGGFGSGTYAEGYYVIVSADYISGMSFYRWSGDGVQYLDDVFDGDFVLVMPSADVDIQAEYVDVEVEELILSGNEWKYNNSGTDLGTTWCDNSYNDSQWQIGNTSIGTNETGATTTISIESNGGGWFTTNNPTTYFRRLFSVTEADEITEASIRMACKDGVVIYINGQEALRTGMPSGDITYESLASQDIEDITYNTNAIDPSLFIEGENIIAVEVHVNSTMSMTFPPTAIDMFFNLSLTIGIAQIPDNSVTQYVALDRGWNLVTLSVEPYNPGVENIFPNATIIKNTEAFYISENPSYLNGINNLHAGDAILVNNTATEQIRIDGTEYLNSIIYNLEPGWNLAGVPCEEDYPLNNISDDFIMIKDFDAFFESGTNQGTLNALEGGKAYFIKVSDNEQLFFLRE